MLAAPAHLAMLLDALPAEATPLPGLQIAIGGAHSAPKLGVRAALSLGTLNVTYAKTCHLSELRISLYSHGFSGEARLFLTHTRTSS